MLPCCTSGLLKDNQPKRNCDHLTETLRGSWAILRHLVAKTACILWSRKWPHLVRRCRAGRSLAGPSYGFLGSHLLCCLLARGAGSGESMGSHCNTVLEPDRRRKEMKLVLIEELYSAFVRLSSFMTCNLLAHIARALAHAVTSCLWKSRCSQPSYCPQSLAAQLTPKQHF